MLRSEARARPGTRGFEGQGRAKQVPLRPEKLQSSFPTRFPELVRLAPKFCSRVGNRTDQHLLEHISFLRVLGDA